MENITLFVSIVIIIFGVLQILLFFKLWEMTNDVKKISLKQPPSKEDELIDEAQLLCLDGEKEKAFKCYKLDIPTKLTLSFQSKLTPLKKFP